MAYNIGHGVEDGGREVDVDDGRPRGEHARLRAAIRHSERLLRHLRGCSTTAATSSTTRSSACAGAADPALLDAVDEQLTPDRRCRDPDRRRADQLPPVGDPLTRLRPRCADARGTVQSAFVPRMVPLGIESDGNLSRNAGGISRRWAFWLEALDAWQVLRARTPTLAPRTTTGPLSAMGIESYERNEGRAAAQVGPARARARARTRGGVSRSPGDHAAPIRRLRARRSTSRLAPTAHFGRIRWLDER